MRADDGPVVRGVRAVDHIGLTVPDVGEAADFFVRTLGAVEVFRHGPYGPHPRSEEQFGRPAGSAVTEIAMLTLGPVNLELLAFSSTDRDPTPPRPHDAGGHHVAFYVDDLDDAVTRLLDAGAEVLGDPMPLPGPESGAGARFIFVRTPWGLFLELVTYPSGKRYEQQTALRLFDPRSAH